MTEPYFSNAYFPEEGEEYKFFMEFLITMINNLEAKNENIKYLQEKIREKGRNILEEKNLFFFVYRKDKEKEYKKYIEENPERKKFVLAVYKNIGTGKSLEYEVQGKKRDFNAIYLEKPTFIINKKANSDEEKMKIIFNLKSLYEASQISYNELSNELKDIFSHKKKENNSSLYFASKDYNEACMQIFIQALGRIHRTDNKNPAFIFLDEELRKILRNYNNFNIPQLPSFSKILSFVKEDSQNFEDKFAQEKLENTLIRKNRSFLSNLMYSLRIFQNHYNREDRKQEIENWGKMRKQILQYPTISDEKLREDDSFSYLYMKFPSKSYKAYQKNDFQNIFLEQRRESTKIEFSEENAKLNLLKACKELQECIKENKIATSFKEENLLLPIVYNNIYKGALGEVLGKYILEKYCAIELQALNDEENELFESFDFKNEERKIYFDFKNYSANSLNRERKELVEKVQKIGKN